MFACFSLSACETMEEFYDEVIVASVKETFDDTASNAELSYCPTCDWVIQEFHGKWEERNTKDYKTRDECWAARRKKEAKEPDVRFRCIHESELR
jgi:hypothetical protein